MEFNDKRSRLFGIKSKELPLDENIIKKNPRKKKSPLYVPWGKEILLLAGHFIVLTGIEKGKIKVQDPNSIARSQILWDYSRIAPQIKKSLDFLFKKETMLMKVLEIHMKK